jgi:hypothetical protein
MKKKIHRIWGISLALVLAISLSLGVAVPVAAADYGDNDWVEWGFPDHEPDTNVGPMAVASDGTIFAGIHFWDDLDDDDVMDADEWFWTVAKSDDGGFSWDDTELNDLPSDSSGFVNGVAQIVPSPNYDEDETVYVGIFEDETGEPVIYRLEEAGDETPIALKSLVDSEGTTADVLFSIDIWYSESLDYNLILAGTDLDVLLLEDVVVGQWIDQELIAPPATKPAFEVNFSPDFDASELIWAVTVDTGSGDFLITSTVAPGRWGQVIDPALVSGVDASYWLDLDFPDDYSSDVDDEVPVVFAALTDMDWDGNGGVFMIEGVEADGNAATNESVATELMSDEDMVSLAVSGEIILAGAIMNPEIYISDDLGAAWDDVTKAPTGGFGPDTFAWTHVVMPPGDFDPDEGVAYASTWGDESAFSRSEDGGEIWNQTGYIDTEINDIWDIAFHPDDPATFFLLTEDSDYPTYSLWFTENGDSDEPDYYRTLCGYEFGPPPGNFEAEIFLVEFAQDADAIYIFGDYQDTALSTWKSTDEGQTFGSRRAVKDDAWINEWVIPDSTTIYAAADTDGFYMSINSGLSWSSTDVGAEMNDIELSPDFDSDETILLGGMAGEVLISENGGDSFDDTDAPLDDAVHVAFDPDYEDAEGDIYAGDEDNDDAILIGEEDGDDTDWDPLEDDTNEEAVIGDVHGLVVSGDRVVYAAMDFADYDANGDGDTTDAGDWDGIAGLARLILDEDDSIWESATDGDLDDLDWLWLTAGSNVLWTFNGNATELWNLEDTLSGKVTLDSPADDTKLDHESRVTIIWDEMTGVDDEYEYELAPDLGTTITGQTDDTDVTITTLQSGTEYTWKVRVAPGEPWSSRWSDTRTFHTALGAPPWAPDLYSPASGATGVPLVPGFSWESANTADGYRIQVADNNAFSSPIIDETISAEALESPVELEYATTYYWRVQALKGTVAISRWSETGVFTTMGEPPPPPATPTYPTPTVTVPPPIQPPPAIPSYLLWTIVGIGAVLIITVIILIVRTRRPV